MTKRRSIIALFLAVAILALGVGYATLTDTLTVSGTAAAPSFEPNVYFTEATLAKNNVDGAEIVAQVTTDFSGTNVDEVTYEITGGFDHDGDNVVVTLTIKNATGFKVKVDSVTTTSDDAHFTATHAGISDTTVINAGATHEFTVTVSLASVPNTDLSAVGLTTTVQVSAVTTP